jgi:hypothetical protein
MPVAPAWREGTRAGRTQGFRAYQGRRARCRGGRRCPIGQGAGSTLPSPARPRMPLAVLWHALEHERGKVVAYVVGRGRDEGFLPAPGLAGILWDRTVLYCSLGGVRRAAGSCMRLATGARSKLNRST